MNPQALRNHYAPILSQITTLPVYGVAVFEEAPGRGWFWAQAKKLGKVFSYTKKNGKTVILRVA